jgi:hypothetical protein
MPPLIGQASRCKGATFRIETLPCSKRHLRDTAGGLVRDSRSNVGWTAVHHPRGRGGQLPTVDWAVRTVSIPWIDAELQTEDG